MKLFYIIVALLISNYVIAADGLVIRGYIKDTDKKTPIEGAVVTITFGENDVLFDITDSIGFYEIKTRTLLPENDFPINIKHLNFYELSGFVRINKLSIRDYNLKQKKKVLKDTILPFKKPEIPKPEINQTNLEGFATNNLVFLIDVSSSMNAPEKFPVLKQSLKYLVEQFRPTDRIAILTFSSGVREVLPSTPAENKAIILKTIDDLRFESSSQGGAAINYGYKTVLKNYIANGNNRIILATDGLFTSGEKDYKKMEKTIEQGTEKNIVLSMFLFGKNTDYVISKLATLAKKGNGNFSTILSLEDGKASLLEEAKAVKN